METVGIRISGTDEASPVFEKVVRRLNETRSSAAGLQQTMDQMGNSAKQNAWALRQVPAQFTDIVVSLQAGQKPLTVLLQQGGQLKDMFGGAGNAARALGGYVAGLISPLSLTVAAVGALGVAYYKGSQEATAYNKALILSGNAAGTTSGQMADMAAHMARLGTTQGKAAEALAAFAATGQIGVGSLERYAGAAIAYGKATGMALDKIVESFVELGKTPLETSIKLNESINYLSLSLYSQIKALDEQGRHTAAATLAQNAYADAVTNRNAEITSKLGLVERAWERIKKAANGAVDAVLEVGRASGPEALIAAQQANIAYAQKSLDFELSRGKDSSPRAVADRTRDLENEKTKLNFLQEEVRLSARVASNRAAEAAAVKAQIAFDAISDANKTNAAKREEELLKLKNLYAGVTHDGELGKKNAADYADSVEKIKDKYKDKTPKTDDEGSYAKLIKSIREKIEVQQQELDGVSKLTEGEKNQAKFLADLRDGTSGLVALRGKSVQAQAQEIVVAYQSQIALEKQNEAVARAAKMMEDAAKAYDAYRKKGVEETASINARAQAVEDEVTAFGLTKDALRELTIVRLQEQKAQIARFEPAEVAAKEIAAIDDRIAAIKRLGNAETALAAKNTAAEAAKQAEAEWKKTTDEINRTLTDALMRAFENGETYAQAFGKTVEAMFKTMVLRPVIQAAVNPISGAINNALGVSSIGNSASGAVGVVGSAGAFGSGVSSGLSAWSAEGSVAGLLGSGSTLFAGGIANGLGTLAGALGPVALGIAALSTIFGDHGFKSSATTGESAISVDPFGNTVRNAGTRYGDSTGSLTAVGQLRDTYLITAAALGIKAAATEFFYAGNTGAQGENPNFALSGGVVGKGGYAIGETALNDASLKLAASRAIYATLAQSELPKYLAGLFDGIDFTAQSQAALDALAATAAGLAGLHTALNRLPFDGVRDLSYAAATALISLSGGLDKLNAGLTSYYTNFYSAEEQRRQTLVNIAADLSSAGVATTAQALDEMTRAQYRALVDAAAQSIDTAEGQRAYAALINLSGAFASITPAAADAAQAIKDAAKSLLDAATTAAADAYSALQAAAGVQKDAVTAAYQAQADAVSASIDTVAASVGKLQGLSTSLKSALDSMSLDGAEAASRASAQASITAALAIARAGGPLPVDGQLDAALRTVAQPSAQLFATFIDYARDFARTKADIAALSGLTGTRLTAQQELQKALQDQQAGDKKAYEAQIKSLDSLVSYAKLQLDAANGINVSVLSLGEALTAFSNSLGQLVGVRKGQGLTTGMPAGTAPAPAANVVIGGGASTPASSSTAADDAYFSAVRMPNGVYSKSYITDTGRIAQLVAARSYLLPLFNDGTSTLADIAAAARSHGNTQADVAEAMGYALSDVQQLFAGAGIPAFATGTNRVPADMLAILHKDEAVVPKMYNPALGGPSAADMANMVAALTTELQALRAVVEIGNENTRATANTLAGQQGTPFLVEIAP